jgi:DNA mismatch repair protein MutS2
VDRDRDRILEQAQLEADATLAELRREAEALRRDLRGLRAERERLTEIDERISTLRDRTGRNNAPAARKAAAQDAVPIAVGESVRLETLGAIGVVRSIATGGDYAEVEVDGKRVRARTSDLVPTAPPRERTPREAAVASGYLSGGGVPRRMTADTWSPVESQVDLRGLTTEEARYRLDQYLNDAYMEGLRTIRVVHGKGTGAVRQAVRDLLTDHALVRSHETAEQRDGGDGATVVHLAT